ncbi:MAG: InlB B-repeat-containing protein, partial [Bacillota bacterium]
TVPDIDTDLTAVDLTIEGYNTNGIKTLNTDKVYVYLPAGDATVTYDDVDYTATVNEDGTAEFTASMVPLAFTDSADYDIPASTVGTSIEDIDVSAGVSGGTPPYTFQSLDLPDGIEISDEGVISGTPAVADADGGTATITVTDSADSAAAESITINYGVISPGAAQAPAFNTDLSTTERVVAAGDSVTLTVAASVSDGGTVTYQWYSNDTNSAEDAEPITGETTNTYTFNATATPNDTTCYFCTATNSCSSATASANSNIQPVRTKNNVATIDAFDFTSPVAVGTVDSTADTVAISTPAGTDVTGLTPAIVLTDSNASVSPSSGTAQDFSSPVTYTVTAEDGTTTRTYTVTVTVLTEDTYTISANPATKDFGSATVGYSTAPAAQTITITNTGNQSVTLVQPTATGYNVTALSGTTLATNGDTATFSIQPKTGLAAGSHNETLTVNTTSDTSAAVSVSFTVNNRSSDSGSSGSGTTKHRLTFDTNGGSSMGFLQYTKGSTVDLSHYTPTREGYSFSGWYLDEALTKSADSVKLANNTAVYAKWVPVGAKSYFSLSGKYKGYLDVDESNWYGTAQEGVVHDVTLLGIMEGDGDGYFRPRDGIRLSEAIKMAAVVHSIYSGDGQTFDVAAGTNWYDAYVSYAIGQDIIGPGDFEDITAYATRAEMAYLFARSLPETEIARICSLVPPDVAADDKYAEEIYLLYAAGVLTGNDEYGTFIGERGITRAEAAAIITRIALPNKQIDE